MHEKGEFENELTLAKNEFVKYVQTQISDQNYISIADNYKISKIAKYGFFVTLENFLEF